MRLQPIHKFLDCVYSSHVRPYDGSNIPARSAESILLGSAHHECRQCLNSIQHGWDIACIQFGLTNDNSNRALCESQLEERPNVRQFQKLDGVMLNGVC